MLRILIVDDHEAVRRGIRMLLSSREDWTVCGEAGDGLEAVTQVKELRPDIVLMDVSMPRMDGIAATRQILRDVPQSKVLIVSQNDPALLRRQLAEFDSIEYVSKGDVARELKPAIERVVLTSAPARLSPQRFPSVAEDPKSFRTETPEFEPVGFDQEYAVRLLASIVDSSHDAIVSKNMDGIITSWNKSAERLFGFTDQEAIGSHITLIVPADRLHEEQEIVTRLKRGERIDHFETQRLRKDRTPVDVSLTISPLCDRSGKVVGASKIVRDVTRQKQAQDALLTSIRQQRALFQLADRLHRSHFLEDIYNAAFDAMFAGLHCDRASILLCDSANVMRFVNWRSLSDTYRAATEGHTPWTVEDTDPQVICIADTSATTDLAQPLKSVIEAEGIGALAFIPLISRGTLMGKFMVYFNRPHEFTRDELDVSLTIARQLAFSIERKKTEDVIRRDRERYDLVAEASQVGFWFCDLPFDKLIWDERVKEHFWLPPEAEVTIGMFYERIHPDDRERTRQTIENAIRQNLHYEIEYRTIGEPGQEKWIRAIGRAFYDAAGHPTRFDGVTLDITQRKYAEEALRQSEERYRSLAATLDLEVRARTSELEERNTEVLRQSEQLRSLSRRLMQSQDEERRRIARELHDSAGQLLVVLGINVANLAKTVSAISPELAQEAKDSERLVQELSKEIRTMSYLLHPPLLDEVGLPAAIAWYLEGLKQRSGLDIKVTISEDFGRLPRDIELALFRVVQEALTNIHRHSDTKNASIRFARQGPLVSLEIHDNGKGISPERLLEIQSWGAGVGIRGMRERVRQFQGEMSIASDGSGTKVVVTVPVAENTGSEQPVSATVSDGRPA